MGLVMTGRMHGCDAVREGKWYDRVERAGE